MPPWTILWTSAAAKDREKLTGSLEENAKKLIVVLRQNPYQNPPPFERLRGKKYKGLYSRRINDQHRLVYEIRVEERIVEIRSAWGHYDD